MPFLPYLAAVVTAVLLTVRWNADDTGVTARGVLLAWFTGAIYCQFFTASDVLSATGLALQTALAVYLLIWWRLNG